MEKKGLKKYDCNIDMDMNMTTLPKKGLKTRPYNIGMEKKGLKKYDYNIDMDMSMTTLPKKGLKKYDYNVYMDMEKEDLKKLSKEQLIKLLLKQKKSKKVSNHEDLLDTTHLRMKLHKTLQNQGLTNHQSFKLKITQSICLYLR